MAGWVPLIKDSNESKLESAEEVCLMVPPNSQSREVDSWAISELPVWYKSNIGHVASRGYEFRLGVRIQITRGNTMAA
ncbi:hypothetical protein H1S01_13595 [Heliobacterium chlorum]|uniref:Uncharacterized protein n=1 Tax=Heliobacterium chlorum TaxID=2698 RepID=A0ABR7T4E7_HELCL|nr:hypothetical protein [Heliobacterium chlorum]MBC9785536.1 hypothetical protein [Heliobacterium chlorum]